MAQDEHSFSEEDLHSYVTRRAAPAVSDQIDLARRTNPSLNAELTLMEQLKPALEGVDGPNPPGDLEWRRLRAQIDKEQRTSANTNQIPSWGGRIRGWQAAAVFLGCLALGQAAFLGWQAMQPPSGYSAASQTVEPFVLAVRFVPEATQAEMTALIQDLGARVVDGPGASGLYRLAFSSTEARDQALPQLQDASIVDFTAEE